MSSSSLTNKRILISRLSSGLRSQSERPSLKKSDISIKLISTPVIGAEKIFSSAAK